MIAALVALRDFFVAVLISWLGVATDSADTNKNTDSVQPSAAAVAMIR